MFGSSAVNEINKFVSVGMKKVPVKLLQLPFGEVHGRECLHIQMTELECQLDASVFMFTRQAFIIEVDQ